MSPRLWRARLPWQTWLVVGLVGLGIGGLGLALVLGFREMPATSYAERPVFLVPAVLLAVVYWPASGVGWWAIQDVLARSSLLDSLPLRKALPTFLIGNIARYVPGTFWFAASRTLLATRQGASAELILVSVVIEQLLIVLAGILLLLGAAVALASSGSILFADNRVPVALVAAAGLSITAALHPRFLQRPLAWFARRRAVLQVPRLRYRSVILLVLLYMAIWMIGAAALLCIVLAITPLTPEALPAVLAAWILAFLLGLVSPITPSGLGVREATAAVLLSRVIPVGAAVAAAVGFRLVLTLAEILCIAPLMPGLAAIMRRE